MGPRNVREPKGAGVAEGLERIPTFQEAAFPASVEKLVATPAGDLVIQLRVPWKARWDAMQLADAPSIMLLWKVKRQVQEAPRDQPL